MGKGSVTVKPPRTRGLGLWTVGPPCAKRNSPWGEYKQKI